MWQVFIVTLPLALCCYSLAFQKLSVGMLMYGAVSEINEFELVVSLPHGLVGYVRPTDISPPYTESLLHAAEVAAAEAAKGDDSSSEDEVRESATVYTWWAFLISASVYDNH